MRNLCVYNLCVCVSGGEKKLLKEAAVEQVPPTIVPSTGGAEGP